jgi:hypothetical protein
MPQTIGQQIEDFEIMIQADEGHLSEALAAGNRVAAHRFVDSIVDLRRNVEDLKAKAEQSTTF